MRLHQKLSELIEQTRHDCCLKIVSPYITTNPIRAILRKLPSSAQIEVTTTFNHDLFVNGSSSIGALRLLASRDCSQVFVLDNLHAKAYVRDTHALIGSANCTDRGLGFSQDSNLEVLCMVNADRDEVTALFEEIISRRRKLENDEIDYMIQTVATTKNLTRAVFRKRLDSILLDDDWIPSCSLKYLLRYIVDGSFYRIPVKDKGPILRDAHYLAYRLGEDLTKGHRALVESISLIPIIQLAVESLLRRTDYLWRCLAAKNVSVIQVEALENWAKACLVVGESRL